MYSVLIFNTHVHFIIILQLVCYTNTYIQYPRVEERKRNTPKCVFNSTEEFSSMGNSERKIEKAGQGNLVKYTLFIYCTSQFHVGVAGMVNISVS